MGIATKTDKKQTGGINDTLVLGILIGLFFGAVGTSLFFHFRTAEPELAAWADGFSQNFGTEMFGAFLTFLLIEVLLAKRRTAEARERVEMERKKDLILQMGSPNSSFAIEATRILQQKGWLEDGTLQDASLSGARLEGISLEKANLEGINLAEAYLAEARLMHTNLKGSNLAKINLERANLTQSNLQWANLEWANLQEANLQEANLQKAILAGANLQGAILVGTDFREADLSGANLKAKNLLGANLEGADLHGVDLGPANLQGITLPDGIKLPNNADWTEIWRAWLKAHQAIRITHYIDIDDDVYG